MEEGVVDWNAVLEHEKDKMEMLTNEKTETEAEIEEAEIEAELKVGVERLEHQNPFGLEFLGK